MKKILEFKTEMVEGGFAGPRPVKFSRVRELAEGEDVPTGAELVPDKTKTHDWVRVEE